MDGGKKKSNLNQQANDFLAELEEVIQVRLEGESENSYIKSLQKQGLNRITQKLGEETVETIIEALNGTDKSFVEESADLLFHYLILLAYKGYNLNQVIQVLKTRHAITAQNS